MSLSEEKETEKRQEEKPLIERMKEAFVRHHNGMPLPELLPFKKKLSRKVLCLIIVASCLIACLCGALAYTAYQEYSNNYNATVTSTSPSEIALYNVGTTTAYSSSGQLGGFSNTGTETTSFDIMLLNSAPYAATIRIYFSSSATWITTNGNTAYFAVAGVNVFAVSFTYTASSSTWNGSWNYGSLGSGTNSVMTMTQGGTRTTITITLQCLTLAQGSQSAPFTVTVEADNS